MQCKKCTKPSTVRLAGIGNFCNACYCEMIERRVRKDIRMRKLINKSQQVVLINDQSPSFFLSEYIIKSLQKNLPFVYKTCKTVPKTYDVLLVPKCMDDCAEEFLTAVLQNKKKQQVHESILRTVSRKEVDRFAKIQGWEKNQNKKQSLAGDLLDRLEKKYPNIKFALAKSMEELRDV